MPTKSTLPWTNYLIELVIVIIGITIAFWLNNIAVQGKENREKIAYLNDIKNDLTTDSMRLVQSIQSAEIKSTKLERGLELISISAPIDSVLPYILEIGNYNFFYPDNFTLTSLLQSGDLKLIDSEQTKRELLRLLRIYDSIDNMQKNFLQALDDNYFPMLLSRVDMMAFKAVDPGFFFSVEVKNYCAFALNETSLHIQNYKYAQRQVDRIMQLVGDELKQ